MSDMPRPNDSDPTRPDSPDNVISADFRPEGSLRQGGAEITPEVRESLDILTEACGPNLVTVIFFGSRLLGTSPNTHSAADLFVVVDDYDQFYRDIGRKLPARRRASIMAALNQILPPNIILLKDPGDLQAGTKCFVIRRPHVIEALSSRSRDHFCRGRMMQRCQIVYARSQSDRDIFERELHGVRERTLEWVPIYLPRHFTVLEYCLRMLEVSYAAEIRPESRTRVLEVFDAQRDYFRVTYRRILERAAEQGRLVGEDGSYRLAKPVTFFERLWWRIFFQKSRVRATLRWIKYMLTFDEWLDYIVRKVERRTGVHVELTPAERRFPLVLLWPKAFRVFRAMHAQRLDRDSDAAGRGKGNSR